MFFTSIFRKNNIDGVGGVGGGGDGNTDDNEKDNVDHSTTSHTESFSDIEEGSKSANEATPLVLRARPRPLPNHSRGISEASTVITGSGVGGGSYISSSSSRHPSKTSATGSSNTTNNINNSVVDTTKGDSNENDNDDHEIDESPNNSTNSREEDEQSSLLSSSRQFRRKFLFQRSSTNASEGTQGSFVKSIRDHLSGSFAEMDKTDYTPNLLSSMSELIKPWEYIITPDHFGTWKRHVAWAKKDGAKLREHTAQRFSSNTVFMTLLLNSELATLLNSATITTEMREDLLSGNVGSMKFYIGMVILMSTFITIYAIISTFTVWGMVTVLSDENALCVLRSSIGQYATQLPSRLVATALCLFLCWVSMFLFILLPIEVALTITIGSTILYLHIVHVYSSFGRLILHSGAMGNQPIFSSKEEEHMRPEEFHNLLSERAGSTAARKMSVVHQYKNVSELLSKRLSVFSVGAFANLIDEEAGDDNNDDNDDEKSVTVALRPPRATTTNSTGTGIRQRRAAMGGGAIRRSALLNPLTMGMSQSSGLGCSTTSSVASGYPQQPQPASLSHRQVSTATNGSGESSSASSPGRVSFQGHKGPLFAAGGGNVKSSWRSNSHRRGTSWGSYLGNILEAGSKSEHSSPVHTPVRSGASPSTLGSISALPSASLAPNKEPSSLVEERKQTLFQKVDDHYNYHCLHDDHHHHGMTSEGQQQEEDMTGSPTGTSTLIKERGVRSVHVGRQSIVSALGMDESTSGHDGNSKIVLQIVPNDGMEETSSDTFKEEISSKRRNEDDDDRIIIHFTDETDEKDADSSLSPRRFEEKKKVSDTVNPSSSSGEDKDPHDRDSIKDDNAAALGGLEESFESIMDPTSTSHCSPTITSMLRQISERSCEGGSIVSSSRGNDAG